MIFDGQRAWFAPSVPLSHIGQWVKDGGVQIRDASKTSIIQYYFSNSLEDSQTLELVRSLGKVVYRSLWIMDSSVSRTKQPLGSYTLLQVRRSTETPRRPQAVSSRRTSMTPRSSASLYRSRSVAAGDYHFGGSPSSYHQIMLRGDGDETQSVRSRASSRYSNASSVVSGYGRRQQVVSRFVIHADEQTTASILANVADFTPNDHGFVAYKIPKMTASTN